MFAEKGIKTTIKGQKAEKLVQKKLWRYGYNVERMPSANHEMPFDLLVDGEFRVDVKSHTLQPYRKTWTFFFNRGIRKDKVDVYAFVFFYPDGLSQIRYIKTKEFFSPIKETRAKKTIFTASFSPSNSVLKKSPLDIFGKPKKKSVKNN